MNFEVFKAATALLLFSGGSYRVVFTVGINIPQKIFFVSHKF